MTEVFSQNIGRKFSKFKMVTANITSHLRLGEKGQNRYTALVLLRIFSGELRHGTYHFYTRYTGILKINSVYGNLKDQMKLDLYICEALSYKLVQWKPYLWAWLSITTVVN